MLRTKKEKIEIYIPFVLIVALSLLGHEGMGLYAGCGILQRLSYPLYHQNIFHALINLWALHQCMSAIRCRWDLVVFYIIAVS